MYQVAAPNPLAEQMDHILYHIMREPLRNLACTTTLLTEQLKHSNNPTLHDYTNALCSNAERLSGIIKGMLELQHLEQISLSKQQICLKSILEKAQAELASSHRLAISYQFTRSLPPVRGDAALLKSAFKGILQNAYESTISNPAIDLSMQEAEKDVTLIFKNPCHNLDSSMVAELTKPFTSANKSRNHLGLGLARVDSIVKRHQGSLEVNINKQNEFVVNIKLKK
ncbi:MAG: hypothetical protein CMM87_03540 [Rickettsiales bacterium]|nr:hypothetical protein [Rickettsiales bacterium]|tara:strand:+ start:4152 stop:4829 length:678 start_codon:yes stop_codon:yes gene_type:complete